MSNVNIFYVQNNTKIYSILFRGIIMKSKSVIILFFALMVSNIFAQGVQIKSGPMVGYSTMREVKLWVQTTGEAEIQINYWEKNKPDQIFKTDIYKAVKKNAYIVQPIADKVEPGRVYTYEVLVNNKKIDRNYPLEFQTQVLWQWHTDPPAFKFSTGSGAFINETQYDRLGKPYGGEYEIFENIYEHHPDFMLWLGDNSYLREADFNSRTGILKRFTHDRAIKELQPLLGSVHNYAIWDDHDFGPDNSDRGFWNKETTLEAFKLFWPNPSFGINGKPGTTAKFSWADADFFLLDDRYYRSPDRRKYGKRQILGDEQIEWLIDNLSYSRAPFKFIAIGGQVLNPTPTEEDYSGYPVEKEKLLKAIQQEGITGVIFLTGDVHRTELTKLERHGTYPLYDFTISPITSGPSGNKYAKNSLRVDGSLIIGKRNYAIFEITGPRKDRQLKCTIYDKNGKNLWEYKLKASELK